MMILHGLLEIDQKAFSNKPYKLNSSNCNYIFSESNPLQIADAYDLNQIKRPDIRHRCCYRLWHVVYIMPNAKLYYTMSSLLFFNATNIENV